MAIEIKQITKASHVSLAALSPNQRLTLTLVLMQDYVSDYIFDLLCAFREMPATPAVRKAALQSMGEFASRVDTA